MKKKVSAVITEQTELAPHIYSLRLKTELAAYACPGQFIGIYPRDGSRLLMRPISICDADNEELRMVYRAGGKGTIEISSYKEGDTLDILGVLGNGYDINAVSGKKVLLLGGGIGIPPMLLAAKKLKEAEKNTIPFIDNELVALDHVENFKPGDIDKYTVVLWLEGSDPECNDNILGGEIKITMHFNSEHIDKKEGEYEKEK